MNESPQIPRALQSVQGLALASLATRGAGIYFLCDGDACVYVGQAVNIAARVVHHAEKVFDSVYFIYEDRANLTRIEKELIVRLLPKYNNCATARAARNGGSASGAERPRTVSPKRKEDVTVTFDGLMEEVSKALPTKRCFQKWRQLWPYVEKLRERRFTYQGAVEWLVERGHIAPEEAGNAMNSFHQMATRKNRKGAAA